MMQSTRPWMVLAMAVTVTAATLASGCAQPYVNIPAQEGDVAANDPNARAVRTIQAVALQAVLRDRPLDEPVAIELPRGTDSQTYRAVAADIEEPVVTPLDQDVEPATTLKVQQVRIRGSRGEVDVLRPRGESTHQVVTVYLNRSVVSGWVIERVRPWEGRIER